MKAHFYYIGILLLFLLGCRKTSKGADNLVTFAKVYGYVKYFHPSDEATQLDWNNFSIYGASEINKCKTKQDLIQTLETLFKPIAPTIKFACNSSEFDLELNATIPADSIGNFKLTYWQHVGVSIGMDKLSDAYKSRRINRDNDVSSLPLFDYQPNINDCIIKEVGDGIYCQIPLTLFCNNNYTFPQSNSHNLKELNGKLKQIKHTTPQDLFLRLGNVINVYNVFQHFYPYFNVVDVNWESELKKALKQSYIDKSKLDHKITLEKFTASLQDGHIGVYNNSLSKEYIPPISWEWIENELVITNVPEYDYPVKIGDIVTHINGVSSKQYFEQIYPKISAATKGWLSYKAKTRSMIGAHNTDLKIVISEKEHKLKRVADTYYCTRRERVAKGIYKEIEPNIWYLNLDQIKMDTINKLLPQLEKCKSIICDLRGYPNGNHGFIQHLLAIDDTTSAWMQIPKIVYPDQQNIVGYEKGNWIGYMNAKKPYLGDKNVIFITDGQAISYAESFMGYIEGYNLATIIGQPTAGTNGNINPFHLPGSYEISWTGMKVIKHDGTQHHGIGIIPDIYVEKTIRGIKDGRDEFLEKAIDLAKTKTPSNKGS